MKQCFYAMGGINYKNGTVSCCPRQSDQLVFQKDTFLPKLISGEWSGTMNLTEPNAGSDVGALTTKAVQENGEWNLIHEQGEWNLIHEQKEDMRIWGFGLDKKTKKIFIAPNNLELEILVVHL